MAIEHFIDRYCQKKVDENDARNRQSSTCDNVPLNEDIPDKTWQVILSLGQLNFGLFHFLWHK